MRGQERRRGKQEEEGGKDRNWGRKKEGEKREYCGIERRKREG